MTPQIENAIARLSRQFIVRGSGGGVSPQRILNAREDIRTLKTHIVDLEAKIGRLTSRGIEDLRWENQELKQELEQIRKEQHERN